jgi:putative oxidoreductase
MDPGPDRCGTRWNFFVTRRANPKSQVKNQPMDKPFFNLLNTNAPTATLVVRLLPGLVFFAEGIKKFMFPTEWGIGRFEKIGIIYPYFSAPFVGIVETVCGLLLIFGLFSRPAALLLLIDISVAILTTKVPLALHKGFWPAEAEARADYSMFMSSLFLLIVGAGVLSLDAWWVRERSDLGKQRQR